MKDPNEPQQKKETEDLTLTNRQGHPVYDNQNNRTVGDRGPTVLENYNFLEKIQPLRPRTHS